MILHDMKNFSNFAATSPKSDILSFIGCGYNYSYTVAVYPKDIRLSIHNGLHPKRRSLTLARCGKIAFPLLITLIFLYMPRSKKIQGKVNNSTLTLTPDNAKIVSRNLVKINESAEVTQLSVSDFPAEIQTILSFLKKNKVPVMLQVNITNNNFSIGDSEASNICLITGHDNQSISGHNNIMRKGELL